MPPSTRLNYWNFCSWSLWFCDKHLVCNTRALCSLKFVSYWIVVVPAFLPLLPPQSDSCFQQFEYLHSFFLMEPGLPFHKCEFCFPREWGYPLANSGRRSGSGYLHRDTEGWICAVHSKFIWPNPEFPDISQACFLLRIQRSAKQGWEMGAILHNTISNSFNDNILSYLPVIFFF